MNDKIGIKRLDHVCWAVRRIEDVLPLLTDLMGMRVRGRFTNEEAGFHGVGLEVPGGTAHFEVLEPYGEDSFLARFLEERGPGLHHVTFEVQDIEAAADAIKQSGIEPFGGIQKSHGWAETYIHPKDSGGVLFQFFVEDEEHKRDHEQGREHDHVTPK